MAWSLATQDGDIERGAVADWDWNDLIQIRGDQDRCANHCTKKEGCFYQQAKQRARDARVIVTNHAMLFAHLVLKQKLDKDVVLPSARITVCDEGHELAEQARSYFEFSVTEGYSKRLCMGRNRKKDRGRGESREQREQREQREGYEDWLAEELERAEIAFFNAVRRATRDDTNIYEPWINGQAESEARWLIDMAKRNVDLWQQAYDWARVVADERADSSGFADEYEDEADELEKGLDKAAALLDRLQSICELRPDMTVKADRVFWVEADRKRTKIVGRPVEVSQFIHDNLFTPPATTVVTSATLTTSGTFDYVIEDLGFEGNFLAVDSPFDFENQALLILPTDEDMPVDPSYKNRAKFLEHAARVFQEVAMHSGGGVLFLFASWSSLRSVREKIPASFPFKILAQAPNGSKDALVDEFKADPNSCLFGVKSFWAGLDVPGEALRCVVIEKLPFCTPKDPLFAYWIRKKGKERATVDYMIQRAMIDIRQGAGRLIRAQSDRGVVVMLDRRIRPRKRRSDYSKYMIPSVPWPFAWGVDSVRRFFQEQSCLG